MELQKCFVVFGLCLLMGSCPEYPDPKYDLYIKIGDYENQLDAWNSQNMLDYKLLLSFFDHDWSESAVVIVKNGVPESSAPPTWLAKGHRSTVPEFFSFIKEEEKRIRDAYTGFNVCELYVQYNTEYHYPKYIFPNVRKKPMFFDDNYLWWYIDLTPLEETEQGHGGSEE
jgi:hypothetical protein